MILDDEGHPGVEVFEAVQIDHSLFEDLQLGAYVKHEQPQKSVDARVRNRGHYDRDSLDGDHDLVIRGLRYVAQEIRLHQHRSSRVRQICQVSRRVSKTRGNDENDAREDHHDSSKHDNYSADFRLL